MTDEASEILIEEISPNGNIMAFAEATAEVVHFYLSGRPETEFGMRATWVRNLKPAPAMFSPESLGDGKPPMLLAPSCAHPRGAPPLDPKRLRIVWFEEGDAAALLDGEEMLAAIPAWSGEGGFYGYARDCTEENPLCWPLKEATAIYDRVQRAEEFWKSWETGRAHWPQVQDAFLREYESVLGKHVKYWGIDGGKWPPKATASFETESAVVLITLGVSIRPMPKVELAHEDPAPHRRIEFGLGIGKQMASDEMINDCIAYISSQSDLPWHRYTWLGVGHTVQCKPCPVGEPFEAMLLLLKEQAGAPAIAMPTYRDDPVNLLWLTPITDAEWALAQNESSGALLRRMQAKEPLWPHRPRESAV